MKVYVKADFLEKAIKKSAKGNTFYQIKIGADYTTKQVVCFEESVFLELPDSPEKKIFVLEWVDRRTDHGYQTSLNLVGILDIDDVVGI